MARNLFDRRMASVLAALLVSAIVGSCATADNSKRGKKSAAAAVEGAIPISDVWTVRIVAARGLNEASTAALSRTQPGVVFTITDSGNQPRLFAVDTTGAFRGDWQIAGATNVDWEAATLGPCAHAADCVYIGDVGDNDEQYDAHTVYRLAEPQANRERTSLAADALRYSYPDGRHDVESMYVAPNGTLYLITKRPLTTRGGELRPALVYSIGADAWTGNSAVVATLVDSLPIVPGSSLLRLVTDAALSPDARHLAVRTYTEAYIFATDTTTGRVDQSIAPSICDLVPLGEGQGEGITWADARGRFVFTSEGKVPQVQLGTCRLPRD